MINQIKNIILYIIKENDTLEKIARDNNITVDDIYRFNPIIKNHHIIVGTPLNLPIITSQKEERISNDNIENKEYTHIPFLLRLVFDSKLYIENRFPLIFNEFKTTLKKYIDTLEITEKNNLYILIIDLIENNNKLISLLKEKNISNIKNIISFKKQKIDEYYKISTDTKYHQIIDCIKECDNLWLSYIYKTSSNQFEEAENIFKKIQKKW